MDTQLLEKNDVPKLLEKVIWVASKYKIHTDFNNIKLLGNFSSKPNLKLTFRVLKTVFKVLNMNVTEITLARQKDL